MYWRWRMKRDLTVQFWLGMMILSSMVSQNGEPSFFSSFHADYWFQNTGHEKLGSYYTVHCHCWILTLVLGAAGLGVLDSTLFLSLIGHSTGAPRGPPRMIPAGDSPPKIVTSIRDGWGPRVPAERSGTRIQVKITLYGNFPAGICGFTGFL